MRVQMDRLMKIVEEQKSAKGTMELRVKLVALTELDDIESYLVTFERIMTAHKVDKGRWPYYLAPQLTGKHGRTQPSGQLGGVEILYKVTFCQLKIMDYSIWPIQRAGGGGGAVRLWPIQRAGGCPPSADSTSAGGGCCPRKVNSSGVINK